MNTDRIFYCMKKNNILSIIGNLSLSGKFINNNVPDLVIVYSYINEDGGLAVAHTKKEEGYSKYEKALLREGFTLLEECYSTNAGEAKLKWHRELIDPEGKPRGGSNYNRYRHIGGMGGRENKGKNNRLPIHQFSYPEGNLVKEWESMISVCKHLGLHRGKLKKVMEKSIVMGNSTWKIKEGAEVKPHLYEAGKRGGAASRGFKDLFKGEYAEEHREISRENGIKLGNWVKDQWQSPTEEMMSQVKRGGEIGGAANGVSPNNSWIRPKIQSLNSRKAHDKTVCCPYCGWPSDANNAPRHIKNCNYKLNFNPLNYTDKLVKRFNGFEFVIYEDVVKEMEERHKEIFPDSPDDSHSVPSARRCLAQIDLVKEKYTVFYRITSGSRWGESQNSNVEFCKRISEFFNLKKSSDAAILCRDFKDQTGIILNKGSLTYEKRKGNYGKPLSAEVRADIGRKISATYHRKRNINSQ